MIFCELKLSEDGTVTAVAKGHPTQVVEKFQAVASLLLSSRGAWRITYMEGQAPPDMDLYSDMRWNLVATAKDRGV